MFGFLSLVLRLFGSDQESSPSWSRRSVPSSRAGRIAQGLALGLAGLLIVAGVTLLIVVSVR